MIPDSLPLSSLNALKIYTLLLQSIKNGIWNGSRNTPTEFSMTAKAENNFMGR